MLSRLKKPECLCQILVILARHQVIPLVHKQKVEKYIYFSVPIRINNTTYNTVLSTEQMKGQDPDILDLYDVHVKKEPDSNLIGPSDSYSSNIAQKDSVVKPLKQHTQSNGYYDAELKVIVLGGNFFWLKSTRFRS